MRRSKRVEKRLEKRKLGDARRAEVGRSSSTELVLSKNRRTPGTPKRLERKNVVARTKLGVAPARRPRIVERRKNRRRPRRQAPRKRLKLHSGLRLKEGRGVSRVVQGVHNANADNSLRKRPVGRGAKPRVRQRRGGRARSRERIKRRSVKRHKPPKRKKSARNPREVAEGGRSQRKRSKNARMRAGVVETKKRKHSAGTGDSAPPPKRTLYMPVEIVPANKHPAG